MKFKITSDEFGKLSEEMKKEYTQEGDDYTLNVEGGEDTGALKRAKEHEKERRQKSEQKARELADQMAELQEQLEEAQSARSAKDKDIEKRWKDKYEKREKELSDQINGMTSEIDRLLVEDVADKLAADLSDTPAILKPHIKTRLMSEKNSEGKWVTSVKDSNGESSAMTLEELANEFRSNKDFAPAIRGGQGSGSGANGGQGGSGNGNGQKLEKPDFTKATPKEKAAYLKSQKEANGQ